MGSNKNHTPITGTPDIRTALNTALGELDAEIDRIGAFDVAVFGQSETDGTDGGTTVNATYNVHPIDGIEQDSGGIVVIASDQFTPVKGTYLLMAKAQVNETTTGNRLQLYNATGAAVVYTGHSILQDRHQAAELMCVFEANGTDAYEIRLYTQFGTVGSGFGVDDGATLGVEVYLEASLIRWG